MNKCEWKWIVPECGDTWVEIRVAREDLGSGRRGCERGARER